MLLDSLPATIASRFPPTESTCHLPHSSTCAQLPTFIPQSNTACLTFILQSNTASLTFIFKCTLTPHVHPRGHSSSLLFIFQCDTLPLSFILQSILHPLHSSPSAHPRLVDSRISTPPRLRRIFYLCFCYTCVVVCRIRTESCSIGASIFCIRRGARLQPIISLRTLRVVSS